MKTSTAQLIINILKFELGLADNRVWLRDENFVIPTDKDMFAVVGLMSAQTQSNVTFIDPRTEDDVVVEYQVNQVNQREEIQIDLLSRSSEVKKRSWEVIAALQSIYSQQQQELNNFKIFRVPTSFVNTSSAEGGSNINRYSITIACFVWYRKEKLLKSPLGDYYDDFTTRVDDAQTIGTDQPIAEFEITPDTPPPP